mmetsp:Transcript_30194/g.73477  ORF Transcript_30194/g.73477 Transcript_30194/m.73477 type:complete len:633 (+) Transcript_30194:289-2187(+)
MPSESKEYREINHDDEQDDEQMFIQACSLVRKLIWMVLAIYLTELVSVPTRVYYSNHRKYRNVEQEPVKIIFIVQGILNGTLTIAALFVVSKLPPPANISHSSWISCCPRLRNVLRHIESLGYLMLFQIVLVLFSSVFAAVISRDIFYLLGLPVDIGYLAFGLSFQANSLLKLKYKDRTPGDLKFWTYMLPFLHLLLTFSIMSRQVYQIGSGSNDLVAFGQIEIFLVLEVFNLTSFGYFVHNLPMRLEDEPRLAQNETECFSCPLSHSLKIILVCGYFVTLVRNIFQTIEYHPAVFGLSIVFMIFWTITLLVMLCKFKDVEDWEGLMASSVSIFPVAILFSFFLVQLFTNYCLGDECKKDILTILLNGTDIFLFVVFYVAFGYIFKTLPRRDTLPDHENSDEETGMGVLNEQTNFLMSPPPNPQSDTSETDTKGYAERKTTSSIINDDAKGDSVPPSLGSQEDAAFRQMDFKAKYRCCLNWTMLICHCLLLGLFEYNNYILYIDGQDRDTVDQVLLNINITIQGIILFLILRYILLFMMISHSKSFVCLFSIVEHKRISGKIKLHQQERLEAEIDRQNQKFQQLLMKRLFSENDPQIIEVLRRRPDAIRLAKQIIRRVEGSPAPTIVSEVKV